MKELVKLKKITTMEDANQVMEAMKSDEIKALGRRYEATNVAIFTEAVFPQKF